MDGMDGMGGVNEVDEVDNAKVKYTKEELMAKSVRELKDLLAAEGYDAKMLTGIEKHELVEKLLVLLHNPVEEDEFPLPLYSNCWPQFILRALLIVSVQLFVASYFLRRLWNLVLLLLSIAALTVRNISLRRRKAAKRRKRA
mmetsp:Transcript_10920/g.25679  ORF Transcript_10920/g.25679 Transcript_10920/m.25679 type:complete len:142 (+) Transcript_10920:94-519(+)